MIPTMWHSWQGKTMKTLKNQWLPGVDGGPVGRDE